MQSGLSSEDEKESSAALTPEGNMTLVDDIGEKEDKSSQQFITLVTKAGNTFYLIRNFILIRRRRMLCRNAECSSFIFLKKS